MPSWAIVLIIIGVFVVVAVAMIAWWISTYNAFIRQRNNVEEAYSTMDVYMKKRHDLIPNLVETVKGYAKHEKQALEGVMQARYSCMTANDPEAKAKSENMLTGTLKTLFSVTENYPDLKADKSFAELQSSLKSLESEIASSRKYYNGCVKIFNTKLEVFPSNIVAKHYKFERKILFEIENKEEKITPKVQF